MSSYKDSLICLVCAFSCIPAEIICFNRISKSWHSRSMYCLCSSHFSGSIPKSRRLSMYVRTYVRTYVCMYVCMYVYVCMACMYVCTRCMRCLCMYVCLYLCISVSVSSIHLSLHPSHTERERGREREREREREQGIYVSLCFKRYETFPTVATKLLLCRYKIL